MSRSQSIFAMQQQEDMQVLRQLDDKYTCYCSNCNFVRGVVIQKKICIKFMENSSLNNLLNKDQVLIDVKHIGKNTRASDTLMLLVQIYSKDNFRSIGQFIIKMINRSINEACLSKLLQKQIENEVQFYAMFARKFEKTILAECYPFTTKCKNYQLPDLVMQDLKADGYMKCHTKVNAVTLRWCIKALAEFHANATKMINENDDFKPYVMYLANQNDTTDIFKQLLMIRAFLNNPILKAFDNNLQEKIKTKLKKAQQYLLMKGKVSVLVHGSFTRSKIFFKKVSPESIKFIDFQTVRLGSPAIDLGRILLTNLPDEYTVSELQKFCKNIIEYYIRKLIKKYPLFVETSVYRDIVNNLFYSYINLDEEENKEIHNHVTILRVLNKLGSFD